MHAAAPARRHWPLDPAIRFLNHGSFGACPVPVLDAQARWRAQLEREPVQFLDRELPGHIDRVRQVLGGFLGARPEDLALVRNATAAVNAVLGSVRLAPGDEIVVTDHEYNATVNAAWRAAERAGARMVVARLGYPIPDPDEAVARLMAALTPRSRLCVVSHVSSPTALVLPIARIVREAHARGVAVLVDGAHAPGMLDVDLDALDADWYAGNLHKWVCAPKGSGFLWARRDRQAGLHPTVTSHGANDPRHDRSVFQLEFDWIGTDDPTAWLVVPDAIGFLAGLVEGGWPALRASMHERALAALRMLDAALGSPEPLPPDAMVGSMAALPLPLAPVDGAGERLRSALLEMDRIEVAVTEWPVRAAWSPAGRSCWLVRVSAAPYTTLDEVSALARTLPERVRGVAGATADLAPAAADQRTVR